MATSPEVTAEWTVTAKLRLIRPSEKLSCQKDAFASHESAEDNTSRSKTFFYKWTSDDSNQPITDSFDSSHQVKSFVQVLALIQ